MTHMVINVANAERIAWEAMADAFAPPPPVDYLAFAEKNIVFSKRESSYPGPYNRDLFPYFDEILRALSPDDPCRIVTLSKSAQIGGTVLANIFTGGSIAMDPGDILYVHPTENNATRWSKMKLKPMLNGTPALKKLFPMRQRDGQDSVLYKERKDGLGAILISGANSPSSLSMVTVGRQTQDDLAKWEINSAGDPEEQADSRSQGQEFAKVLKVSTPLVEPGCRITRNFKKGSREHFHVPCPDCGHMHVLDWDNMLENLDEDRPEDAHFTCPDCGSEIHEHHRNQMVRNGQWIAEDEKAKRHHRSFHIWSAYSILMSWERIARRWLDAKGDPKSEQVFLNDVAGRAFKSDSEAPPWEEIKERADQSDYDRGRIPTGPLVFTFGIDCQKDRVEWLFVGFGRNRDRYVIDHGVVSGHISEEDTQAELNDVINQDWRLPGGTLIKADQVAIDGNYSTVDVFEWVKRHPKARVIMARGGGQESAPLIDPVKKEKNLRTGKILKYGHRFWNFNASALKMGLYRSLTKTDPTERSYIGFPRGLEDGFFQQLTAERRVGKTANGFTTYRWEKDADQPNEVLDMMNLAEVAAIKIRVRTMNDARWDEYEARAVKRPDSQQGDLEDLLISPSGANPAPPAAPVPTKKQSMLERIEQASADMNKR